MEMSWLWRQSPVPWHRGGPCLPGSQEPVCPWLGAGPMTGPQPWHEESYVCRNCGSRVHGLSVHNAKRWAVMSAGRLCRDCRFAARRLGQSSQAKPDIDQVQPERLDVLYDVKAPSDRPRPWLAKAQPVRPKGPVKPRRLCPTCRARLQADGSCWECSPNGEPRSIFGDRLYCDICRSEATTVWLCGFALCGLHAHQSAYHPLAQGARRL